MAAIGDLSTISLSKTSSILSPLHRFPPTLHISLSSSFFSTRIISLSLSPGSCFPKPSLNPQFRAPVLRSPSSGNVINGDYEDEDDDEEIVDDEGYESEGGDESFFVDEEELEAEARVAVQEYSRLLSGELRIEEEEAKETGGNQKGKKIVPRNVPDHLLPKVAIVGRPNVGKSALFNRLVGGNRAIVVDEPGVTRDRLYGRSFWGDNEFMVVDTGGVLMPSKSQEDVVEDLNVSTTIGMEGIPLAAREAAIARMPSQIERQAATAVEESSLSYLLLMVRQVQLLVMWK